MNKKEILKYYFSVEGQTEKWYLQWLEEMINKNADILYKAKFDIRVEENPQKRAKQITILKKTAIIHVFDFEEASNEKNFRNTLDNMRDAQKGRKIRYDLAYTNFSFELWMILHKKRLAGAQSHKHDYLKHLNMAYGTRFQSLHEYKEEQNFRSLLKSLSLADVNTAIKNADAIMNQKKRDGYQEISFRKYTYFSANPALNIQETIKTIFKDVGFMDNRRTV